MATNGQRWSLNGMPRNAEAGRADGRPDARRDVVAISSPRLRSQAPTAELRLIGSIGRLFPQLVVLP